MQTSKVEENLQTWTYSWIRGSSSGVSVNSLQPPLLWCLEPGERRDGHLLWSEQFASVPGSRKRASKSVRFWGGKQERTRWKNSNNRHNYENFWNIDFLCLLGNELLVCRTQTTPSVEGHESTVLKNLNKTTSINKYSLYSGVKRFIIFISFYLSFKLCSLKMNDNELVPWNIIIRTVNQKQKHFLQSRCHSNLWSQMLRKFGKTTRIPGQIRIASSPQTKSCKKYKAWRIPKTKVPFMLSC